MNGIRMPRHFRSPYVMRNDMYQNAMAACTNAMIFLPALCASLPADAVSACMHLQMRTTQFHDYVFCNIIHACI